MGYEKSREEESGENGIRNVGNRGVGEEILNTTVKARYFSWGK